MKSLILLNFVAIICLVKRFLLDLFYFLECPPRTLITFIELGNELVMDLGILPKFLQ